MNINKLTTHIDELRVYLASNDIDVLAINETKLNESNTNNEVNIPAYDIVRRDRTVNGGGGVCFYVKQSIHFSLRNDLSMDNLENLCIEIRKPHSKSFIVATWYKPPNALVGVFSEFETLIGKLDSLNVEYYLLGDLNCDIAASRFDNITRKLINITDVYGLTQLITEPTRVTETTATLIDLIFTNSPDKIVCSGVRHIGISDHSLVFAYRKLSTNGIRKGHSSIICRNFKHFNREKFRNDIASQDWDCINRFSDPNDMWNVWKELFLTIANKHAPLRTIRVRARGSPWITSELKKQMRDRDALKVKAIQSRDPNDWLNFKKQRNIVNNKIMLAKQAYYQNTLNERKGDSKKTWQIINELTSRKSGKISVKELKVNGYSITNPVDLANEFNNHFATIGPKLAEDIPCSNNNSYLNYLNNTVESFQFRYTTTKIVFSLLKKLNKSKSAGLDKISARLILECADLICTPLCCIFNQSLSLGVFPDDLKCARVTPLFKDGERDDLNNYRPISVISVVAKVFEKIVYDQLYAYLSDHEIICKKQSGFRSIHSTVTALLEATDSWALNIDQKKINAVVFLDLKKAFDTVNHEILLSKLKNYGILDNSYNWFESYLDNRAQKCFVNGSLSKTLSLSCGVPQGTILGPLLFLLYINDLPNCLMRSEPRMYADDTHLTYAGETTEDIQSSLNHDLENVKNWLIANKLTLNMTKTEFMLIGSRQKLQTLANPPKPIINGTPIKQVTTAKSLGVLIDNNLNWSSHIDKLTKKLASGIGAIKRVRHLVPQATLHTMYSTLVQPHFDYCNVVWGNCGVTLQDKLQKLQNRAARVLTFSSYDENAKKLFKILSWKNLAYQRHIALTTMVYKCLHGLAPEYLCNKFTNRKPVYDLRDSERKINVPLPRTNYYKNSFSYRGAVAWNSLPRDARIAESVKQFKHITTNI